MKKLFVFVIIFYLSACAPISPVKKMIEPKTEFLIADSQAFPFGFYNPCVYGDIVAWRAWGKKGGGIFYKDLRTGNQYQISHSNFDGKPAVFEETIVWANHHRGSSNYGIDSYNIATGKTKRLVANPPEPNPRYVKIFGDTIVWLGNTGRPPDIVSGVKLSTGEMFEIYNSGSQQHPNVCGIDIYGDIVVWGNYGIWAKNLKTGRRWKISSDTDWPYFPLIHKNIVLWMDQVWYDPDKDPNDTSWDIYGKNISTGKVFPIDTNPSYHSYLVNIGTNGKILLWRKSSVGKRFQDSSLWATELSTGNTILISKGAENGAIYGDLVVYSKNKNIYGYYLDETSFR